MSPTYLKILNPLLDHNKMSAKDCEKFVGKISPEKWN